MIRTDIPSQSFFSFRGASVLSRLVASGSIVRVEILGKAPDGATLVRIAGKVFTAAGIGRMQSGDTLSARVQFTGNTVFLHPLTAPEAALTPDVFTRLGIAENPVAVTLITFFQKINARLDGKLINQLARTAARFPGKEGRAAEAAAILAERGIEPTDEAVGDVLDFLEGRRGYGTGDSDGKQSSGGKPSDRDYVAFINHKKGHDRHWIIIPFSRTLSGSVCAGSVRFLIDTAGSQPVETRVTCSLKERIWEFEVIDGLCSFSSTPPFDAIIFEKFIVYLKESLVKSGISGVSWHTPGEISPVLPKSVNLEI